MNTVKTITGVDNIENVRTSLGIGTNGVFGWTVNIPSSFKVRVLVNNKRLKLRWEFLTPAQQFSYFLTIYLPSVIRPNLLKAVGVVELTRAGNMHCHLLCQCDTMVNDYDMWSLRKGLLQNNRVLEIARGSHKRGCRLNYVHFLEDIPAWIQYLNKDINLHQFPVIIIS